MSSLSLSADIATVHLLSDGISLQSTYFLAMAASFGFEKHNLACSASARSLVFFYLSDSAPPLRQIFLRTLSVVTGAEPVDDHHSLVTHDPCVMALG
jgi:hypothetical protein